MDWFFELAQWVVIIWLVLLARNTRVVVSWLVRSVNRHGVFHDKHVMQQKEGK